MRVAVSAAVVLGSRSRSLGLVATIAAISGLYAACSCLVGGYANIDRDIAKDVRDVRATGDACHEPKLHCDDHWAYGGGCAVWLVTVASPGACDVTFELANGTTIARPMHFEALDGCMCNGNVVSYDGPTVRAADFDGGAPPDASRD